MAVKGPVTVLLCFSMVQLFGYGYLPDIAVGLHFTGSSCQCGDFPLGDRPFVAVWNSPTEGCRVNFSININLKDFDILENPGQTWNGKFVTVFYNAQLGLYPYFTNREGTHNYNGGMPQLVNLTAHFAAAKKHIIKKIPDPDYRGLAIIDWEGWRPTWERNFDSKRIYQSRSVELVHDKHPDWPLDKLIEAAKREFERSARLLMEGTLKLGQRLRPKGLWGFYGFPDCFGNNVSNYQCSEKHRKMNDKLSWLFSSSTALFPSIYMFDQRPRNAAFARGRLREALRLAFRFSDKNGRPAPVFPYFRHVYEGKDPYAFKFLSDEDLRNTIGQAAEMGVAGVVMWGNRRDENTSPQVCRNLNNYMGRKLGPYLKSVQRRVEQCSEVKCNGRGRCVRDGVASTQRFRTSCTGPHHSFETDTAASDKQILQAILQRKPKLQSSNETLQGRKNSTHLTAVSGTPQKKHNPRKFQGNNNRNNGTHLPGVTSQGNQGDTVHGVEGNAGLNSSKSSSSPDHESGPRPKAPNGIAFCNDAESGSPRCVLTRRHPLGKSSHAGRIPKVYMFAIGGSLGGALLLSTVYIVTYYYFNVRKKTNPKQDEPEAQPILEQHDADVSMGKDCFRSHENFDRMDSSEATRDG